MNCVVYYLINEHFLNVFSTYLKEKYIFIIGILNELKLLLYYHKADDPHKGCKQEIKSDK